MKVSQKQVTSSARNTICESSLSLSQAVYHIEEVKKLNDMNTIQLLVRNVVTHELCIKHPLSLYLDKCMLNLFRPNDIRIIMIYVIYELQSLPEPVKFEGYDYGHDQELLVQYDMRFKKELIKK
jgi:hypothetical protein